MNKKIAFALISSAAVFLAMITTAYVQVLHDDMQIEKAQGEDGYQLILDTKPMTPELLKLNAD